ncbi:hypothetical protein KAH94_03580 [bacterium]|nr:hypothetical protein [bacterium]
MKKLKIIALFSALFIAGLGSITYMKLNARRGAGRRRGGFGIRVGVGGRGYGRRGYRRGYGHRGYRRGYGHRGYWGLGTYTGSGYSRRYNWQDSQGLLYWRIQNNSNSIITVESDRRRLRLSPGQSGRLYRDRSFVFTVKNIDSGKRLNHETREHVVHIGPSLKILDFRE